MATGDVINGLNGTFKQGNAVFATATEVPVTNVNVTVRGGVISTPDSESSAGWADKVPSKFKEWSGSCEGYLKEGQTELDVNTEYEVHFAADDTGGNLCHWSGSAILTELGIAIPIPGDEAVKRTMTFEDNGALTKTEP